MTPPTASSASAKPSGGRENALAEGPIARTMLLFALPTLASNVLQSLNGSINAIWVGRLLGASGLAATTNANMLMFLAFSLTFGFGMAFTVFIGQSMGRRDMAGVHGLIGAGISFFLVFGIVAAASGWIGGPTVLRLLATPAEIMPEALAYARITFLAAPASMLLLFVQFALRGTGDAMTPLRFIALGTLIDVGLNPLLILGIGPFPQMGIAGSALAGLISTYISLATLIIYIYVRELPIRLRAGELHYLRPSAALLGRVMQRGVPMGLQMIVMTISSIVLMGLVNRAGVHTAAAYGAVNQIWIYIQMPGMAIGVAVSTMVAQSIGANRWDRVGRITLIGLGANAALTGLVILSALLPGRAVPALFLSDADAIAMALRINLIATWSYLAAGVMMVLTAVPRANGATIAPLFIMTIALLPGRLGFAFAAFPKLGTDALWWSFPVSYLIAVPLAAAYYRWGGWRSIRLMGATPASDAEGVIQTESEPATRPQPAA